MKFDWYQASIPGAHPETVMDAFSKLDYYGDWEQTRPGKGYDSAAQFVMGDEVVYHINFGGQNEEHGPNITGTGGSAPKVAQVLREQFPNHRVSRLDACVDFHHPGVYDYLRKRALKVARERKVQVREIVKPLEESDDGRTLYLGSTTSAISGRIYEKGKQLGVGQDWVRAELQVRPKKHVKQLVAHLSPLEVWGLAKWSHSLAMLMGNEKLQRVEAKVYQPSDHERAYRFMLKQYHRVFEQMLEVHGSPETVGAQIFKDLEDIATPKAKASLKPV